MIYLRKILLALLLLPLGLNAIGLGVYVPFSFAESSQTNYSTNYVSEYVPDYSISTNYKESAGIGFVFDTNVQQKRAFSYRLGIEIVDRKISDRNATSCIYGCSGTKLNALHTFSIGIIKNENLRLWIGARLNIAITKYYGNHTYSSLQLEAGLAPVIGANFSINKSTSLSFDLDYRVAHTSGYWHRSDDIYGEFGGDMQGATARFYILFKIHDLFNAIAPSIEDDSL